MFTRSGTMVALTLCCGVSLAGEIVLDKTTRAGATDQRNRAREYVPAAASGVIVPVDESDSLFPQHGAGSLPDGGAGRGGYVPPGGREGIIRSDEVPAALLPREDENLSKARAYMKNTTSQSVATMPVVACENVNNVSGRIGDDTLSGSVITIIQNGKQVKARCK